MIYCLIHDRDYNDCDCNRYPLCIDCNRYIVTDDDKEEHEHHDVDYCVTTTITAG